MTHLNDLKIKPELDEAEAGIISSTTQKIIMGKSRDYRGLIRPEDMSLPYKRFVVKGDCMKPRNIFNGDVIFIESFKENASDDDKFQIIKENDILLIYLDDKRFKGYKIRGFSKRNEDGSLETFYYKEDGTTKISGHSHRLESIGGIVKRKLN